MTATAYSTLIATSTDTATALASVLVPSQPPQPPRAAPLTAPATPAPGAVLQLAADYRQAREDSGRQGGTDATIVKKHLFWLSTGKLPERTRQGHFIYADLSPSPGWRPLPVAAVGKKHIDRYRRALTASSMTYDSVGREIDVLAGFYRWLLRTPNTPVAEHRDGFKGPRARGRSSTSADRFYTAEQTTTMLTGSGLRIADARCAAPGSRAAGGLLKAEVEDVILWLLWGTGASAQDLCTLNVDDIDFAAGTIRWTTRLDTPLAGGSGGAVFVQPIPPALLGVLEHYLHAVRPRLELTSSRLLGNPDSQHGGELDVQVVRRATQHAANNARLASLGGSHNPGRWATSYGMRVLESERGTMVAVLRLQALRAYVSLERKYGAIAPQHADVEIDEVFSWAG